MLVYFHLKNKFDVYIDEILDEHMYTYTLPSSNFLFSKL